MPGPLHSLLSRSTSRYIVCQTSVVADSVGGCFGREGGGGGVGHSIQV